MPHASFGKAAGDAAEASLVESAWSSSEMLIVAAGGFAMLLVVGVLDMLELLP